MNAINRTALAVSTRHPRRSSLQRLFRPALLTIVVLAGAAHAGWMPGLPPSGRSGGWTGNQPPSPESMLPRVFQCIRALAIVDQFPPALVILFESYFTEWYLDVAANDRSVSFSAFIEEQGVKDPADQAMHMALFDIAMRLMQLMPR